MTAAGAFKDLLGAKNTVEDKLYTASQWQLTWWKFRKHQLAVFSTVVIVLFYLVAIFCEFLAPYPLEARDSKYALAPPQRVHWFREGRFGPYVYGRDKQSDPETWRITFVENEKEVHPIRFFVRGGEYEMWGLWEMDLHLFGVDDPEYVVSLLGMDKIGRDLLSRLIYGSRISLSVGLVGVFLSFVLGLLIGGASGFFGGLLDEIIQRVIELLRSIPTIPLWMSLSAALPRDWPIMRIYFGITILLSMVSWTSLARVVRGKLLSLREEDFVMAARLAGASNLRIIVNHLLPSFFSYIIVSLTMAIPGMILGETSLSFIGLGLQPPALSWGVLLKDAQTIRVLSQAPWLLIPGIPVVLAVLAFSFLGDGLRDAADPYSR